MRRNGRLSARPGGSAEAAMQNIDPTVLSAVEAARRIAGGQLTAEALMRACLERIKAREPQVQAFEHLAAREALCAAQAADRGPNRGRLHGLPFAAKDTFDT